MAAALLVTYERHHYQPMLSRNSSMKKAQRFLKGCATDIAAVESSLPTETVAESDGRCMGHPVQHKNQNYGTSGRAPSETASEDSCTLKRKSISLNAESARDSFTLAAIFQGFSSKDLSRDERRLLRKRLKLELEQVQSLYRKLEVRELQLRGLSHSAALQGSQSDIHVSRVEMNGCALRSVVDPSAADTPRSAYRLSRQPSLVVSDLNLGTPGAGSKEKRTPKANQLYLNSEFVSGKDKMLVSEKLNSKPAAGLKRSLQGKLDLGDLKRQKTDMAYNRKMSEIMRQCGTILKKLMSHRHGWVFNEPVDFVKLGLRDYFQVIKKPMDLGTIRAKLENDKYTSPLEFAEDVRLTFSNAMTYNPQGHDVYIMADILRKLFEERWESLDEKIKDMQLSGESMFQDVQECKPQKAPPLTGNARASPPMNFIPSALKRSKAAPSVKSSKQPKIKDIHHPKLPMTFEQKRQLSRSLESLPNDKIEQIIQLVKSKYPNLMQTDDEIEVDIDAFDTETLWELHQFITNCNMNKGKSKKAGQMVVAGGINNLQLPNGDLITTPKAVRRGADGGEEDVDIGEDMPSASFPPVVIDNDGVGVSKLTNSSSSSSHTGCSSSDSDSGSSSGSDFDADAAWSAEASKVSPRKEPVGSAAVWDQRGRSAIETDGAIRSISDIEEEDISLRAATVEPASVQQEGESTIPERQVSPEKLLRVAFLINRFADTILKAQEKTLPVSKGDRLDPEKLRKEREELERRQREEKARLQAEARAAELARKKAEAEAAAEARRKREAEREAARLALQKMEKTVEIDENNEILKDLEMLRTAAPEHIPSSGDETSPVHSPNEVSAFAFQGGNPLEQLGLFMKEDEDEEDEDEHEHEHEHVLLCQQRGNMDGSAGEEDEEGEIED